MRVMAALLVSLALGSAVAGAPAVSRGVEYPSVAAALEDLKTKPGASVHEEGGWTIIGFRAPEQHTIWSFTPASHPAHPAVVKRRIYEEGGSVMMKTEALCQADKAACDGLMVQFQELQRQLQQRMQGGGGGT